MPFTNEVIGSNGVLIRNWLQSQNYVAGVSGWQITKDGNAEFNNGTFRGSIAVGPNPGPRFVVNNTATGDVIDVYGSSGQLLMNLRGTGSNAGELTSYDPTSTSSNVSLFSSEVIFNTPDGSVGAVAQRGALNSSSQPQLFIQLAPGSGAAQVLTLYGGSADGSQKPDLQANSANLLGSLLQNDTPSLKAIVHLEIYTITTDGSGNCVWNHHCNFTPTMGFLACEFLAGGAGFYEYAWFTNPFTANTANAHFNNNVGSAVANTTLRVYGLFVR